ncbi:hypothetical protein ACFLZP_01725 [Patescibacteria group bacterium]
MAGVETDGNLAWMLEEDEDVHRKLIPLFVQAQEVKLYQGLYRFPIKRTLLSHILTCRRRARNLPIDDRDKVVIRSELEFHDLPEIMVGDVAGPLKVAGRAAQAERQEIMAAMQMFDFDPGGFALWQVVSLASRVLKGKSTGEEIFLPAFIDWVADQVEDQYRGAAIWEGGLVAKIIDLVDGNEFFHQELTSWVMSGDYDSEKMPQETALVYTFQTTDRFRENLRLFCPRCDYLEIGDGLLDQQLARVAAFWDPVPEKRIPPVLQAELDGISLGEDHGL